MTYVIDTSSLRVFTNFFPDIFPAFWTEFDLLIESGKIVSVREVKKEFSIQAREHMVDWLKENSSIFKAPNAAESKFVSDIFTVKRFQDILQKQAILKGRPVADPFLIAYAKIHGACLVTEEKYKPNGIKIPNICEYYDIECTNLKGLMMKEGLVF